MKKNKSLKSLNNNLTVIVYFLSSVIWLNVLRDSFANHLIGVAFIIAGVYGVVAVGKKQKFLF